MELTKEQLLEINTEIQAVLTKHGVALQPTMGISYVVVPKPEVLSPIQNEDLEKN